MESPDTSIINLPENTPRIIRLRMLIILWAFLFPFLIVAYANAEVAKRGSREDCASSFCVRISEGKLFGFSKSQRGLSELQLYPIEETRDVAEILFVGERLFARQVTGRVWGYFLLNGKAEWVALAHGAEGIFSDGQSLVIMERPGANALGRVLYYVGGGSEKIRFKYNGLAHEMAYKAFKEISHWDIGLEQPPDLELVMDNATRVAYRNVTRMEIAGGELVALIDGRRLPILHPDRIF